MGNSEGQDWNFQARLNNVQTRLKISNEIENSNQNIFSRFGPLPSGPIEITFCRGAFFSRGAILSRTTPSHLHSSFWGSFSPSPLLFFVICEGYFWCFTDHKPAHFKFTLGKSAHVHPIFFVHFMFTFGSWCCSEKCIIFEIHDKFLSRKYERLWFCGAKHHNFLVLFLARAQRYKG